MCAGIGTNNVAITEISVLNGYMSGPLFPFVSIWETVHFIFLPHLSAVLMTMKVATSFATTAMDVTITHAEIACPMQ